MSGYYLTNEQLLHVFTQTKTATAVHVTEDAIIQTANDAMLRIWGKDQSVIGKKLEDALPELKGQPFIDMFKTVWREGLTISGSDTAAHLEINGILTTFYFDFEYRAIKNELGNTICILHSAIDVTERVMGKQAMLQLEEKKAALIREQEMNEELAAMNEEMQATNEELFEAQENLNSLNAQLEILVLERTAKLAASEARLRKVFEQAPLAFCILTGPDLIIEFANENMLALWARTPDVIGQPHALARPEPDAAEFLKVLDEVYATGIPFNGHEVRAYTAKGNRHEWGYFNFTYQPVRHESGAVTGVLAIVDDVTEAVLLRQQSEKMNHHLNLAIDAARLSSWHIEPATMKLHYNAALARLFGYEAETPMTYDMALAQVVDEYRLQIEQEIEKAIAEGGDYDITYKQRRFNDGEIIWLRSLGRVIRGNNGEWGVFSGFVMDITVQKKDEERKNDFISMVSHELKTPLTTMSGYVQLAQAQARATRDSFTEGALEQTLKQVRKMTTMINGFLNMSRLESGKMHIDKKAFDMAALLKEVADESASLFSLHPLIIAVSEPGYIFADRDKIGQVVSNFISNAVKYSSQQLPVELACVIVNGMVQVSVTDSGIGIAEEHQAKIFNRYYRIEENQSIAGFGIGLYLCAEIIERHNGRIWVTSEPQKGASFYFSLPLHKQEGVGKPLDSVSV